MIDNALIFLQKYSKKNEKSKCDDYIYIAEFALRILSNASLAALNSS